MSGTRLLVVAASSLQAERVRPALLNRNLPGDCEIRVCIGQPFEAAELGQAVEDALRTFPADELIILHGFEHEEPWFEEDFGAQVRKRFDLPVTEVALGPG